MVAYPPLCKPNNVNTFSDTPTRAELDANTQPLIGSEEPEGKFPGSGGAGPEEQT